MSNKIKCTIVNDSNVVLANLVFEANILITTMSDYLLNNHTISTNTIDVVEPTNKLKDANGDNRFTFLFNGYSSYSDIEYCVYFDTVNNTAFMINNVDYIDTTVDNNGFINLYGYKLGGIVGNNGDGLSMTTTLTDVVLPAPADSVDNVDILQLNLHGIVTRFSFNESKTLDTDESGYRVINLNTFIKVDKTKLFGDDTLLPLNSIQPSTMIKFSNKYIGKKDTDYIYIPVPV